MDAASVAISTNGSDWVSVGAVQGGTSGIDIDAYVGSGVVSGEKYTYFRISDLSTDSTPGAGYTVGADIDAVGAISTVQPPPPAPIPEPTTMLLFGTGLVGLAGLRRRFKN